MKNLNGLSGLIKAETQAWSKDNAEPISDKSTFKMFSQVLAEGMIESHFKSPNARAIEDTRTSSRGFVEHLLRWGLDSPSN